MNRKFSFTALCVALLLTSCGPSAKIFEVEVRDNSSYDLDPGERRVSVFGVTPKGEIDSTMTVGVAYGLATRYEKDKGLDSESVGAYTIPEEEFSSDVAYMEQLMLGSASHLLVFIRNFELGAYSVTNSLYYNSSTVILPYTLELSVYDATIDSLLLCSGVKDALTLVVQVDRNSSEQINAILTSKIEELSTRIGEALAGRLSSSWERENWMLIDYENDASWHKAYTCARNFEFGDAIKLWMPYTEEGPRKRVSYAAFNIAVSCEMMGNTELAKQWVAYSLGRYPFEEARLLQRHLDSK